MEYISRLRPIGFICDMHSDKKWASEFIHKEQAEKSRAKYGASLTLLRHENTMHAHEEAFKGLLNNSYAND